MTISKRERFLIFVLILVALILSFIMFVILPLNQSIQDNEIKLSELELQQSQIEIKLALENTLVAKREDKLIQLNDEFSEIEQPLLTAEYERWVLPLTDKYNMRITQASLGDLEVATPDSQQMFMAEPSYRIKELVMQYLGDSIEEDFIPSTESVLLKQSHTYNVVADYENYLSFLDEVTEWDTTVYISASNYNFEVNTATFTFDVYSIHKIEEGDERDYSGDYLGDSEYYDPTTDPDYYPPK